MSSDKVARLLTDFDQDPGATRSRVVPFDHLQYSNPKTPPRPAPPPIAVDDGYQRGRAEGYASALAEYEQKLEYEKDKFNARLEEERHNLLNEIAAKLAGDIADVGNQIQERVAGVAARLLEPLIAGAVQKQAAANFVEHLSSITSDSRRPALRITGPAELLELIRSKLGVRAIAVELRAAPDTEVSIIVDQIVLETQMKIWTERLKFAVQT